MNCKKCGNEIKEGENFCSKCGKAVNEKKNKKYVVIVLVIIIAGAIIASAAIAVPKIIEHIEEVRYQQEMQLDLDNIKIELKTDKIILPYQGTYNQRLFENEYSLDLGKVNDYKQYESLINSYTGGTLEITGNIDINTIGIYEINYKVTSEKGNTKIATILVEVKDYMEPAINIGDRTITIEKGTSVNILEGVTAEDNVDSKEELTAKIVTEGDVDVNKIGSYEIKYRVTDNAGLSAEETRIYKVIEKKTAQIGVTYRYRQYGSQYTNGYVDSTILLRKDKTIKYVETPGLDRYDFEGTYSISGDTITAHVEHHSLYLGDEIKDLKLKILDNNRIKDTDTGYIYKAD